LRNLTLTPAAKAAALRLLEGAGDPHACLRLDVTKGSGGVVRVYGVVVGKEERCDRAFECEGLKVVFHQLLDGEFGPHVIDWSTEKGRFVSRPA
jgi:Fe-S cluster assembly iron-binding protein IscA